MDARTGRSVTGPRAAWLEIDEPGWLSPTAGLPFGRHLDIPRLVAAIFGSETTRLEYSVPPMSEEWLERHAAESEKHVDRF